MALRRKIQKKKIERKIEKRIEKAEEKAEKKEAAKAKKAEKVEFNAFYRFLTKGPIVLRHSFEQNIRAKPLSTDNVDPNGGFGAFAQFEVEVLDKGKQAKFKNVKTGKFLRIVKNKIDVGGIGGPFTIFNVRRLSVGIVKLESAKEPGKFVAVSKDSVKVGKGGPFCRLTCLRLGKAEPFMKPYRFAVKAICVLETKFGGHLRVKDGKSSELLPDGGKKSLAQFEIIPIDGGKECKLLSKANGKYVRIQHFPLRKKWDINCGGLGAGACVFKVRAADAANYVRFESKNHKGKYIGVGIGGKKIIIAQEGKIGSRLDLFTVYRD